MLFIAYKKSHCGLNESMNFNPVGRLAKHGVRNITFQSLQWITGCTTVYLACGATNLRKSYHGLAAIIKLKFKLDPYSRCMFVFCNRRRTSIKVTIRGWPHKKIWRSTIARKVCIAGIWRIALSRCCGSGDTLRWLSEMWGNANRPDGVLKKT